MPTQYLSLGGVAARIGVTHATAATYLKAGRLPEPDAIVGQAPGHKFGWLPETIDTWNAARPGHGGRPRKNPK